jgi:amidophosphoribosyltransferase
MKGYMKKRKNKIDKPLCNCGIFGVFNDEHASATTYLGLHALQHRGQEAAGIVSVEWDEAKKKYRFHIKKDFGLVTEVFRDETIFTSLLTGTSAIGHNRYSTKGSSKRTQNIQPFSVHYHKGNIALAHNGNLTNHRTLRDRLEKEGTIFQTTTDSEIFLHLIAKSKKEDLISQILDSLNQVKGAYSLVIMTDSKLIGVRDPHGVRPLTIGKVDNSYYLASETCALDIIGAENIRDVEPGEIVVIDDNTVKTGEIKSYKLAEQVEKYHHCIFEYIYFSRPDSFIFGESVDKVRRKLGKSLAEERPVYPDEGEKVIVMSVPDSSNTAALGYADRSKKMEINTKLEIGLIRNHYVGRTFIQPEKTGREMAVRRKFNVVRGVIKDRKVVIIDDSIVRGTTSKKLIQLIREAGPKEIHFRVSSPPIISPCYYGMDFPSKEELIANKCGNDVEKIREYLGVDSLEYLSEEKLLESVPKGVKTGYCTACFSGKYPIPFDKHIKKDETDNV